MRSRTLKSKKGIVLVLVVVSILIISILGFSVLHLAGTEIMLTQKDVDKTTAFYLAEAGFAELTTMMRDKDLDYLEDTVVKIENTALGEGTYEVDVYYDVNPPYAISTGQARVEEKKIKAELSFLSRHYDEAIYAGNVGGGQFVFSLRGQGVPGIVGGREIGGRDMIFGNAFVDGDISLHEESSINPSPFPNPLNLNGDADSTGSVSILDNSSVSGVVQEGVTALSNPDLLAMNYHINNTHNVGKFFVDEGIDSGYLPNGHELRDVVVKNPADRVQECAFTSGDDYFLEPVNTNNYGAGEKDAKTPLHLGNNRIYYIDGDVWVHNKSTYGMLVDGKVTIVATGDIHISDNIKYADDESLLGLVALGKYDDYGELVSGGNIYFGDPRYGTMYTVSALMFASDSFLYNTDSVTGDAKEPTSGFSVLGNLSALNEVSIERDWYSLGGTGDAKPAHFDTITDTWLDMENGTALTAAEINSLRHYQMKITYDDRVRTHDTQPPGLPRGRGGIFAGLINWEEVQ